MWYIVNMSIFASVLTGGSNNHQTTAEEVNALATDFVSEGVVGAVANTGGVAPATGGFAVNAQGSPAMAVDVSAGVAYVTATPTGGSSQTLRVKSTATEEVTIAANSTGSTRYDWIYIKIDPDNAADPAADGSDVATLVTSRSTSSSSDDGTPPTYGYPIAVVTVANGATSITNANITDKRELATSVQDNSITASKLDFATTTDANGWTVGLGFWEKAFTWTTSSTTSLGASTGPTDQALPVGVSTYASIRPVVSQVVDNSDGSTSRFIAFVSKGSGETINLFARNITTATLSNSITATVVLLRNV